MTVPDTEVQQVAWIYDPVAVTVTAHVQGDGRDIVVATLPATPPE